MSKARTLMLAVLIITTATGLWVAQAGGLQPPAPPGPTFQFCIFSGDLPLQILDEGTYVLGEDIVVGTAGIEIAVSNVTIDLKGFRLSGGTGDGIYTTAALENIEIKNGIVSDWGQEGIDLRTSVNSRISGVRAEGNSSDGIRLGDGSTVTNSTAANNGTDGIDVGRDSSVLDSVAFNNGLAGIGGTFNLVVSRCVATQNGGDGIAANSAIVSDSNASTNNNGITVDANAVISGCQVMNNVVDGIRVTLASYVHDNVSNLNGLGGSGAGVRVFLGVGGGNRIESNQVSDNQLGIQVTGGGNVIVKNSATSNGVDYAIPGGNFTGTIVASQAAMNAATNDLINLAF